MSILMNEVEAAWPFMTQTVKSHSIHVSYSISQSRRDSAQIQGKETETLPSMEEMSENV